MTRRRNFGNVRKLASGRYQARYIGPDGLPTKAEHTFPTKGDALRFLADMESARNSGTWRTPDLRNLSDYAADWLAHRDLAVRTRELYGDLLRLHIQPQLGAFRLVDLTTADVRRWQAGRLASTGRTAASQAYRLLRAILNTAVGDGLLMANPCKIKGAADPKTVERPYMSQDQAARLIDALPLYLQVPATITVLCHLRLGELLALQRRDIDLRAGVLHVRSALVRTKAGPVRKLPKNGHSREIHMPPEALAALRVHLATSPPALPAAALFLHPNGRPLSREQVGRAWRQARFLAEAPQFHWHDLRHAGLTWAAEAGATIRETMHRAGHKSMRAAMIYQHHAQTREATLASRLRLRPESLTSANETPDRDIGLTS